MNASDLPYISTAQRIDAAFRAILRGEFNAPEVFDVLWGSVGDANDYWRLRGERAWRMRIEDMVERAHSELRVLAARARNDINDRLDELERRVAAARSIA